MDDYSHKERPALAAVQDWLGEFHGTEISGLDPIRGGYWSSAWSYRSDGRDLVLRLGESADGYRIDEAARRFAGPDIPVPDVVYIGEALGKAAAISHRHFGSFVEEAPVESSEAVGLALRRLFAAMRAVAPLEVEWYLGGEGVADWKTWLARDLSVPDDLQAAWSAACRRHETLDASRTTAVRLLREWLPTCPERRDLIHRDLLHQNVLVDGDRVTGIFSWKHSLFGDFLYDVAACSLWGSWHPAIAAADLWGHTLRDVPEVDLVDAEHRHRMYQLHIAVEHLYWYVITENDPELLRLLGVMEPLLDA